MTPPQGASFGRPPGWNHHWETAWIESRGSSDEPVRLVPATVTRIDKGGITVSTSPGDDRLVVAAKGARQVVVGDVVGLDPDAGRIEEILPRHTVFERRSPGVGRDQVHISARALAANMDLVLILQPLDRGVSLPRLARELVLSWESGAQPVVVLTKADLVSAGDADAQRHAAASFAPGCDVICVSARTPDGLSELGDVLTPGSVTALLGSSGAGKSTLVNALAGHPVQLTAEVRESDRRGRHTTTAGQMIQLANGTLLIDTPGIRGVGLWAADDGMEKAFADLSDYAQRCRFRDCTHANEPGCGVLEAVRAGLIPSERIEVFHALSSELDTLAEGMELLERTERREENRRSRNKVRSRQIDDDDDDGNAGGNGIDGDGQPV